MRQFAKNFRFNAVPDKRREQRLVFAEFEDPNHEMLWQSDC
jgi:hypothetical protein